MHDTLFVFTLIPFKGYMKFDSAHVPIESLRKTFGESPLFVNRDQVVVGDFSSVYLVFRSALTGAN